MRIVQIIDRLNVGGAERVCVTLATLFHQKGFQITVMELLSSGLLKQQLPPNVPTENLHRRSRFDVFAFFALVAQLKKYDVIHVHMRHVYRYVFLANLLVGKRLIFHDHYNQYPSDLVNRLWFWLLFRRHIYISVDKRGCQWAVESLGLKAQQVFCLPNVVLKKQSKPRNGAKSLVLVSNVKREKNIEFILPLLRSLSLRFPDIRVDVIGRIVDLEYYKSLRRQLIDNEVDQRISFVTDVTEVQELLGNYLLGLHFSTRESGPLVLLEYLSQDLPFVSFLTGEIADKLQKDLPEFFLADFEVKKWTDLITAHISMGADLPLQHYFEKHNNINNYFSQCVTIYQKSLC